MELGEGPKYMRKSSYKKRVECLERISMQCPKLPYALQVHLERRKLAYCKMCPEAYKRTTGSQFLSKINLVVAELGVHYQEQVRVQAKLSHYDKQQLKIHQKKWDYKRAFEDFVIGLEAWVPKSMMNLPT